MSSCGTIQLAAPRLEDGKSLRIAGLSEHYTGATMSSIYQLWEKLMPHLGRIPGRTSPVAYGLVMAPDKGQKGIKYVAGVEVALGADVGDFTSVIIPAGRYLIFRHDGHVSKLNATMDQIWHQWLPASDCQAAFDELRATVERYGEGFDPRTGFGDMEVWLPVRATGYVG